MDAKSGISRALGLTGDVLVNVTLWSALAGCILFGGAATALIHLVEKGEEVAADLLEKRGFHPTYRRKKVGRDNHSIFPRRVQSMGRQEVDLSRQIPGRGSTEIPSVPVEALESQSDADVVQENVH